MKKVILFIFSVFVNTTLFAGEPKYPVSSIPEEMTKNSNVVIRDNTVSYKILSRSKARLTVHLAITILNEKAKDYAEEVVWYDKLTKIADLSGSVYDAAGKQIRKLKNSEIYDQSAFDGSLYSDNRLKSIDLSQGTYPYTVEYEYSIEYKFLFYIPDFVIIPGEKVSVQHSVYALQFPADLKPRYEILNNDTKPEEKRNDNDDVSVQWTFENIKPIKFEHLGPSRRELIPRIVAAPSKFEYEGYVGDMSTWQQFGQWIGALNRDRNILPEETRRKIVELTADLKTPEEKIRKLYEFLQNRSRYVSIQLGIGGFQPFEATVVDRTGYGDCKALSNYMVSILEVIGIKANYTLIMAGDDAPHMRVDFPSSQFNHAVVSVPVDHDTIWLECTSQTNPFGYMGTFTGNRRALAITPTGAKIVRSPVYKAEQNVQSRSADVFVTADGNAKSKVKTRYSGLQYENGHLNFYLEDGYDDQRKWIQKNTDIPSFDIKSFLMVNNKERVPSAIVNLELTLNHLASVSGKRMFLTPNLMNRPALVLEKTEHRKAKIVQHAAYIQYDTIRYHLPEEIYPESLPESVKIDSRFGEYEAAFKVDQGSVVYIRKIRMNDGEFPPESFTELVDFYRGINKADNAKIVFLNKT